MLLLKLVFIFLLNQGDALVEQNNVVVDVSDMDVYVHGLSPEKRYTFGSNPELIERNLISILNMNFVYDHILNSGLVNEQAFINAKTAVEKIDLELDSDFIQTLDLDYESFEKTVRKFILKKEYFARMRYWLKNDVEKTLVDSLAKDYFLANKKSYEIPEKRHLFMITLDGDHTIDQTKGYLRQLLGGQDFSELAIQISDDQSVGLNGGDLDLYAENQFKYPFSKEVFKSDVGVIPQIFKYKGNMYLIKVEKIIPKQIAKFEDHEEEIKTILIDEVSHKKMQNIIDTYSSKNKFITHKDSLKELMNRYIIFKES